MNALRQTMIEDLQLRGLSERTQESYVQAVRQLAAHYHKSPNQISEEELRQYFLFLKNVKHVSRSTHTLALCGIKFFFEHTLQREWHTLAFTRPAKETKLPVVLSMEEVRQVLSCVHYMRYRVCLTTIYACGLRLLEGVSLQVKDINIIYHALFQASAQATQTLAHDPHRLGAQIGMVGVLHTWTRNLFFHPHVHYLVPGGGLKEGRWICSPSNFFLPVRALSKLFRSCFQRLLCHSPLFPIIPAKVWSQDWVVHCLPVGDGQAALKYLAPYIYRVAISNRRLLAFMDHGSMENSQVTFQYRTSDTGALKRCTLSVEQFLQRFLQHILPKGFVKVRYFGFFAPNHRSTLTTLQNLLAIEPSPTAADTSAESDSASPTFLCPACGSPMIFIRNLTPCAVARPLARSP